MSRKKAELIETRQQVTRCLVVHVAVRAAPGRGAPAAPRSDDAQLAEILGLSKAIDLNIVEGLTLHTDQIRPSTFLKSGQVQGLKAQVAGQDIGLVVINAGLSPIQQRNLEKELGCKVIDRTGLILEIFGARAATREGRLQVELAHLTYQKSRLVRSWTHLERQRGGAGFLGGPGETQIEADRRVIDDKIAKLKKQLVGVVKTRQLHRKARKKVPYPIVALVGYTNAGKSTLFNLLTSADVMARDQLFATLDPTMRQVVLPSGRQVILSDTVGFVSDLPTQLVAAFRATLEEVLEADVIIHVRNMADQDTVAQRQDVLSILEDLGITPDQDDRQFIEVQNKIDLLDDDETEHLRSRQLYAEKTGRSHVVLMSATDGDGVGDLLAMLDDVLAHAQKVVTVSLPPENGALMAWLYRHGDVQARSADDDGVTRLTVSMDSDNLERLKAKLPDGCRIDRADPPSGIKIAESAVIG